MSGRLDPLFLFSIRRPALALGLVAALTIGFAAAAPRLRVDVRAEKVFPARDPRLADYEAFRALFGRDDETALCLLELPGSVLEAPALDRLHALTEALGDLPEVDRAELTSLTHATFVRVGADDTLHVGPFYDPSLRDGWDPAAADADLRERPLFADRLLSHDRRLATLLVPMAPGERDGAARRRFVDALTRFFAARLQPGERVFMDGFAVTYDTVLRLLARDVTVFFSLALLLLTFTLGAVFRRVLPTALSIVALVVSIVWTLGTMALLDVPFTWISTGIPVMILVTCIGDAIHLVTRYHQRLAAGDEQRVAMEQTLRDVGLACLYTSLTTATGFFALLTSQIELVRELGVPVGAGVLYAYVVTMLLLPPLLLRAAPPPPGKVARAVDLLGRPLERLVLFVGRWPRSIVVAWLLLVLGSLPFLPHVSQESRLLQEFDDDEPIMQTRALFEERMGGVAPLEVLIDAGQPGGALRPDLMRRLLDLSRTLREERFRELGVLSCLSGADLISDAWYTFHDRRPEQRGGLPDSPEGVAQLRLLYSMGAVDPTRQLFDDPDAPRFLRVQLRVRNMYTSDFFRAVAAVEQEARAQLPPDVTVRLTGATLMSQAVHATMVEGMASSFLLSFACIAGLLLVLFRSLRLALLGLIPNLVMLPPMLVYMVVAGVPLSTSTSIVFSIAFGIAIDDTTHFLSALAEKQRAAHPDPIGATLRQTGLALVLSSVVLGLGFFVLALSNFRANREFGAMLAVTLGLAMLADLLLLPALLHLVGRLEGASPARGA